MEKRPKGRQKSQLLGWTKNIVHSVLKQIIIKKIYVCKKCFLFVRMKSQKILTYRITGTIKTKFSGKFQNLSVAKAKLLRNLKVVALLCFNKHKNIANRVYTKVSSHSTETEKLTRERWTEKERIFLLKFQVSMR